MFHRIKNITAKDDFILSAVFFDGTIKEYDVKPLFAEFPVFSALKTVHGLFEQVKVDAGGYGISWNDELDLASDELWLRGREEWDPDYTKLTPEERIRLEYAENGEYVNGKDIDWDE